MSWTQKIGDETHTFSGFGSGQPAWDGSVEDVLPGGTDTVYLVIHGTISMTVDVKAFANGTPTAQPSLAINPTLVVPGYGTFRGWSMPWDRTTYNRVEMYRNTPIVGTFDFTLYAGGATDPTYCEYGARLKPGQQEVLILSEAALAAGAILVPELAWLAVPFGALVGATAIPGLFCTGQPPAFPTFTADDFIIPNEVPAPKAIPKIYDAWVATNWRLFCECKPATGGGLDPARYPTPSVSQPAGVPAQLDPIVCDASDVCTILNTIQTSLRTLTAQLALTRTDLQLIQRQQVPFAYVPGPTHVGLGSAGTFAVQAPLGLVIQFTSIPASVTADMDADVRSYYRLGWVNLGTADGYMRKIPITHNPMLLMPIPAFTTEVEYKFEPGVVGTISELRREP